MSDHRKHAFGHPGVDAFWAPSRKSGVGRTANPHNRAWFTIGAGILNEIYYPRIDQPCTKDMGLIVTDGESFFSEEKCDCDSVQTWAGPGIAAFELVNTQKQKRYRVRKQIVADPLRSVILQKTIFEPLDGAAHYRVHALLAPHLGDEGMHNNAWCDTYKGMPLLFAESRRSAVALASSTGWKARSVGFLGKSDGWQDLHRHKKMEWHFDVARDGNVALTGELDVAQFPESILLIGLGRDGNEAAQRIRASLLDGFERAWDRYLAEWRDWQKGVLPLEETDKVRTTLYRTSAAVLRAHEATDFPGAMVASLSVPWGEVHKENHAGGYHIVWARDCSQSAIALLALGAAEDARGTLEYLQAVQEADGHWPQAFWVDGTAYWMAVQIDSIAAPLLLFELLRQENALSESDLARFWPMIRNTAAYICRNGPVTEEDRWERNSGFSPYTLAVAVAALVIAAQQAAERNEAAFAEYFFDTADAWNAQIENWTYCSGSELAHSLGLSGYYCRIVPASKIGCPDFEGTYALENSEISKHVFAREVVSPDAWGLVRYGLRAPDDPRMIETIKAIDATLKTDTAGGPVWHRYNYDGYGEDRHGRPFHKVGIGRAWPLLTGERAHLELAAGRREEAARLFEAMESFADSSGLLSEQVWDAADIPEKALIFGKPSGSARPLAWTHAEHVQLLRSIRDGRVFNCPRVAAQRYGEQRPPPRHTPWRFTLQTPTLLPGTTLRIETQAAAQIRWKIGDKSGETPTTFHPAGMHLADLPTGDLRGGKIVFTVYWVEAAKWERGEFEVAVT